MVCIFIVSAIELPTTSGIQPIYTPWTAIASMFGPLPLFIPWLSCRLAALDAESTIPSDHCKSGR